MPEIRIGDPIADEYLGWCRRQNQPENTLRRRRSVLRSVGNPGTATREELEAWWDTRTHLADVSRGNELAILRRFYTWCQIWEHRMDDPTVRLEAPAAGSGAPKPFTRRELDRILEHVKDDPPLRRAILLGAWAGLRRAEAASLSWNDIDIDRRKAHVTGKGRKTRIVTFGQPLLDALMPDTGGNVVTGGQQTWTADWLGRRANDAIRAAGVQGTFHKLRHRYGSVTYQMIKDPKALAAQMGHASASTTMSFYAAAADDAAEAIANAACE